MDLTLIRYTLLIFFAWCATTVANEQREPAIVHFNNGKLVLGGELFLPEGEGPFPAILYNHGSAPGMLNSYASAAIAPRFVGKGWAFFMPYRRGQGLSADQGPYIIDLINKAREVSFAEAVNVLIEAQVGAHLDDQMAAFEWLKEQRFIDKNRIAVAGNSFGGVQVILGIAKADYCAGIDASGAAESWDRAGALQDLMKRSAVKANGPVFFFQAENDYNLAPSKELFSIMQKVGRKAEIKIYPRFGVSAKEGHAFAYQGVDIWFKDVFTFVQKECIGKNE